MILISSQAALLAQSAASMAQAQSATNAARNLLAKSGESKGVEVTDVDVSYQLSSSTREI